MKASVIGNKTKLALGLALAVSGTSATANLLEYSFIDVYGESKKLSPEAVYANPQDSIEFALSAGLERRVRLSIMDENDILIGREISHRLGVDDRIQVNGNEYYGAKLKLPAPQDGQYTINADILTVDGKTLESRSYRLVVDTQAPSVSPMIATNTGYSQVTSGPIWKLGQGSSTKTYFRVTDIEDASPIMETKVALYREDGTLQFEKSADYDAPTKTAQVSNDGSFFPASNLDENFKVRMSVTDRAGNTWESDLQTVQWDSITNAPTAPFGVYDPDSANTLGPGLTGFVPYEPGMAVKTNPVRLAFRVPLENWHETSESGIHLINSLGENKVAGRDDEYVYLTWSAPFGNVNGNYTRWRNFGQWGGGSIRYSLKLDESVPETPAIRKVEYRFDDVGWHSFHRRPIDNSMLPISFDQIRVTGDARPYDQVASHRGTCTIPAGETSCTIDSKYTLNVGSRGYLHERAMIQSADGALMSSPIWAEINWNDQYYPSLEYEYDEASKELTVYVKQPGRGQYFDRLRLESSWIEDEQGNKLSVEGGKVEENGTNYTFRWNLKTLPEGNLNLVAAARERHGPETRLPLFPFTSDKTAPELEITTTDGDKISLLDQFVIKMDDAIDVDARITEVILEGGPADDRIHLSTRKIAEGEYKLEYPLMFPSVSMNEQYRLTVKASDNQGNETTESMSFAFEPSTVLLNDGQSVLIPAVAEGIDRDKAGIFSEPLKLGDGSVIAGTYDLLITLRSDSDFGMNVAGLELQPGETATLKNYDFSGSNGRLNLPLHATEEVVGKANLMIYPAAPDAEYVLAAVQTWMPNPQVTFNGKPFTGDIEVQEALEAVDIQIQPGPGDVCSYTVNPDKAGQADPFAQPKCFVDWSLPETIEWHLNKEITEGYVTGAGSKLEVGYDIYLPQPGAEKGIHLGSKTATLNVIQPDVRFGFDPEGSVTRNIMEFSRWMVSQGDICDPTMNVDEARISARLGKPKCFIEWTELPEGVEANPSLPVVQGVMGTEGLAEFRFNVTYFDPEGNASFIDDQLATIEVIAPDPIGLNLPETDEVSDDGLPLYHVGIEGDSIGEASMSSSPGDLMITISQDGNVIRNIPYSYLQGKRHETDYSFNVWVDAVGLWEEALIEVTGAYQRDPEIQQTQQFKVVGVPSQLVHAKLEVDGRKHLDTEAMPVTVSLDGRGLGAGYEAERHGNWQAQLFFEERSGETHQVSDWIPLGDDGTVTIDVDLNDKSDGYVYAQMQLDAPLEEYSRQLESNRNYINILRGGAVEGHISDTRASGRSVFNATLRVRVDDLSYEPSVGDIDWLINKDDAGWEKVEDGARGDYVRLGLEAGDYQIKARIHNQFTGITSETEVQEILVYDVPDVVVNGPYSAFRTQEVELSASTTLRREDVPIDNYHVEWSSDGGETWEPGLTKIAKYDGENERPLYKVRVRDKQAPTNGERVYAERTHRMSFFGAEGPRARIIGPRRLERGVPGTYQVDLNPPRRNMDVEIKGEWVLPDGTTIPGTDPITYNPSESDVENGRAELIYRSWVVGFEDEGAVAERVHRIAAWQYEWPEWDVFTSTRAMEAPAQVRLVPRTPGWFGWLDNEQYEWTLPSGAEVVDDNPERPTIRINEPGDHNVVLKVTDARGNSSVIEKTISLKKPDDVEVHFSYYTDNSFMRAPLEVRPRITMLGGHRLDRVAEREIIVNGESVVKSSRVRSFSLETPGTYEVTAKVYSSMGEEAEVTDVIEVVPNKLPVCDPVAEEWYGSVMVKANCSDEDGRIYEVIWEMNGEQLPSSSYRYRFTESQIAEMGGQLSLVVSAKDDAGAVSVPVTVRYSR